MNVHVWVNYGVTVAARTSAGASICKWKCTVSLTLEKIFALACDYGITTDGCPVMASLISCGSL